MRSRFLLAAAAALSSSACIGMLPAPTPMAALNYTREADKPHRCLLVMLPGRGDRAADYASHGFLDSLQKRPIAADVVVADAVYGYYARRNLVERLKTDVVEPARARGYEEVWLFGISMGGLGSLFYAQREPGLAAIVLFAPFLGDEEVIDEISKAGGATAWKAPEKLAEEDYQRMLWGWLQGALAKGEPRVYLGFGTEDRMAPAHRLLAAALPKDRVFQESGGHDWATWRKLWDDFLEHSDFAQRCADTPSPQARKASGDEVERANN